MKLSDVVARFLADQGIRHVFTVSGGASLHLIHSIAETKGTSFVCPQHEQAGAMAADGYARVTGGMGCAVPTSGPGATNLITGICCFYYDSVPVLYLTRQVATFRAKGTTGVRQIGFQEADTVDICRSITKYAVLVQDPYRIRYELQRAVAIAKAGRPGPVLADIPDDLQRMDIDPAKLVDSQPEPAAVEQDFPEEPALECLEAIRSARRWIFFRMPTRWQSEASARTACATPTLRCRTPIWSCRSARGSTARPPEARRPRSRARRRSSWWTSIRPKPASSADCSARSPCPSMPMRAHFCAP